MGLLNLSGILKTAGAGFAGYGADKQRILAEALQQRAAEREATNDAIANYVKLRGANKLQLGDVVTTIPTIGFNVENLEYKKLKMTIWCVS